MPKYVVDVVQSRWAYSTVEVEAEDENAARDQVDQMLADEVKVNEMFSEIDFNDLSWVNDEIKIAWAEPADKMEESV